MFLDKIAPKISRAGLSFVLLVSTIVPATALLSPVAVSAAACNVNSQSGGGGSPLVSMSANASAIDSTAQKASTEFTPSQAWTNNSSLFSSYRFALSDCSSANSDMSLYISGQELSITFYDGNRSGAYVQGVDYNNEAVGVVVTSASNTNANAAYTMPTINASEAQLLSVDLSNSGWIDVYLKQGAGANTRLVSFLAASDTTSFYSRNNIVTKVSYSDVDASFTECSQITGSKEAKVRVLADDVAIALTAIPEPSNICASFDVTSYDAATKTASLKHNTVGVVANHALIVDGTKFTATKDTAIGYGMYNSLALTTDGKDFSGNYIFTSNSSAQQVYFTLNTLADGKSIPKETPVPVVGAVIDFSAVNVDLAAKGVDFDTSFASFSAFAHNVGTVTKDGSFTLFVPHKTGDTSVGVCVGAANLAAVSDKCTGIYYLKDGQTKTSSDTKSIPDGKSVKASIVTVGANKYWQIEGLTGSGGFSSSLASDPATGISVTATSLPAVLAAVLVTVGVALTARRFALNKIK